VKDRIARAAARSGRKPEQIMLVAVTKNAEPDQIRDLIQLGHQDFAENRVQHLLQRAAIIDEWMARHRTVSNVPWQRGEAGDLLANGAPSTGHAGKVRWHMIGHLQRNKAKKVIETCSLIHSVDTLRLAEEIQAIAVKRDRPVDVLLQVNCSNEPQKHGCAIAAAAHLAEQIETMLNVRLRGMMTMAALSANPDDTKGTFERCRELFEEVRDSGAVSPHFNILSMGMSSDFEIAIAQGANLVRVGSAIFGAGSGQSSESPEDDDE
jgi:pyridoxal phosphate enzyme (YggS family)